MRDSNGEDRNRWAEKQTLPIQGARGKKVKLAMKLCDFKNNHMKDCRLNIRIKPIKVSESERRQRRERILRAIIKDKNA